MTRTETATLLSMLKAVWSAEAIDDDKIDVYHWALAPFPVEAVHVAAARHVQTSKWFPKPAELVDLIGVLAVPDTQAGPAWEAVTRQINRLGVSRGHLAAFDDPAVAEAVWAVGWSRLCLEELTKTKPEFLAALAAAQTRIRQRLIDGGGPAAPGLEPTRPEVPGLSDGG